ncbi:hypothetical protein GTH52_02575 [Clostridium tyrobutyricum]|jgi:hypothetical protein|uniref:Uncharacterized protein n=1 Tax=Clostridium tyrobutyricum DIVETGP TaxID=1408889 RepID=W6ND84_CLOTY|nr:hypothetical protein [Clostridium tyrobutyricum]AND85260.1 hypothetical protein CTK_C20080 [Clostridium tyrobutyricum]ANP69817.1 hypothetical protein BA182_09040 [Clostridium tyrobutyricum]MBR9646872.1 hypothetical protein [Clostridium tyrobutyricum]MBV4415263.1 hypothetical protein [Clostridium tyrobutyricum]MBV4420934.1 hypothetical protein [Clostridium tyrobutyricum]
MYRYPNMGYGDYTDDMYDNYEPYYYNMYAAPPMYPPMAMYPVNPYMMYNSMNYNMQQPTYESTYEPFDCYEDEDHGDDEFQNLKMRTVDISDVVD